MIYLAAYTAAETLSAYQWARQPQKIAHSRGGSQQHMVPWAHAPNGISISSAFLYSLHVCPTHGYADR